MLRLLVVIGLLGSAGSFATGALAAPADGVSVTAPARSAAGELISVSLSLPSEVAAVDGRILLAKGAAEVVGVATNGKATGLRPESVANGAAFGAFDLNARTGKRTSLTVVVDPLKTGRLQLRVVVDAASDAAGNRINLMATDQVVTVAVGRAKRLIAAPKLDRHPVATKKAVKVREAKRDGKIDRQDLDVVRAGWSHARTSGPVCGATVVPDDVNADGCVDIVDVQATRSLAGTSLAAPALAGTSLAAPALAGTSLPRRPRPWPPPAPERSSSRARSTRPTRPPATAPAPTASDNAPCVPR
ncbi:MAG: hypothetical protein WKF78_06560 [Candidatus Limnocylindrales bacterium]